MGVNVHFCFYFYFERFGTSLHDAVTLAKCTKLADEEMIWRACMIK